MRRVHWYEYFVLNEASVKHVLDYEFHFCCRVPDHFCKFNFLLSFVSFNQFLRQLDYAVEWRVHFVASVGV